MKEGFFSYSARASTYFYSLSRGLRPGVVFNFPHFYKGLGKLKTHYHIIATAVVSALVAPGCLKFHTILGPIK